MKRILTTNFLLLAFVNTLVKPFWIFGVDRAVQNTLGAGEYGIFYTLFNISLLFNILLDFGLTNFNNREISRHPQLLAKYLSNMVGVKAILAVVYGVVTLLLALVLGYGKREFSLLLILVGNQALSSFVLYLRSNLSGLQLFRLDSALSVLDKALMILICGVLLWTRWLPVELSVELFALAQTAAHAATACVVLAFVLRHSGRVRLRLTLPFSYSTLKGSFPYALLILLMSIYSRVDSVLLERLLPEGKVAAGVYAQAFRLLDAANMFPFLCASLLLPIFSRMIKNNDKIAPFVGFSSALLLVPVLALAIPTLAFRSHLMDLLYVEHTAQSSQVLGVLMGSFVFISVGYIFSTLLTAQGNLQKLNRIAAVAVVLSISVQLFMVGRFGVLGAAYGNLITNGFVATATTIVAFRHYGFRPARVLWYKSVLFVLLSACLTALLFALNGSSTLTFAAAILLILLLSVALGLVKLREVVPFFTRTPPLE